MNKKERWDARFAQQFDGWTDAHRAATFELRALLYQAGVTLKSSDARWTLDEAAVVGLVVRNIAWAFGGPASRIIGGVTIKRTHASRWPLGFAGRRCYGWEGLGMVRLNDSDTHLLTPAPPNGWRISRLRVSQKYHP